MQLLIISLFVLLSTIDTEAQALEMDSLGFKTFQMTEGDTTYIMKQYFMAFLKTGPNRAHTDEEAATIQTGHLNHLNKLAEEKKISIAGPFGDDGEIRGIVIFNVATQEEVESLVAQDPAVIAGRLILEIHPWWAAKGSKLE